MVLLPFHLSLVASLCYCLSLSLSFDWYAEPGLLVLQCEFVSAAACQREGDRTAVAGGVSSAHTLADTSCAAPGKPFFS